MLIENSDDDCKWKTCITKELGGGGGGGSYTYLILGIAYNKPEHFQPWISAFTFISMNINTVTFYF